MPGIPSEQISVFAVGRERAIAEGIAGLFQGTRFTLRGVLDVVAPPPYAFTPINLAVVLRALTPLPRCFIVGEAVSNEISADAVKAWTVFVKETGVKDPLLIDLQHDEKGRSIEEIKKIPKDVLIEELLGRMEEHFGE